MKINEHTSILFQIDNLVFDLMAENCIIYDEFIVEQMTAEITKALK